MHDSPYAQQQTLDTYPLWQDQAPALPQLDIELTERCNNACTQCYLNRPLDDPDARARELTAAQWQDILGQAAALGALSVRMTGGEVLAREDFAEIYLAARRLGLQVQVLTNARLITPAVADLWARIPPRKPVEITLYGMRPASYDAVACHDGAYDDTRRGIALLEARGIPFIVKMTVLPANRDDADAFHAWAATIPWMREPPTCTVLLDLRARRDSAAKNRCIQAQRLAPDDVVAFLNRHRASARRELRRFCAAYAGAVDAPLFGCGAGHTVCVDAFGMLLPCIMLRDPALTYDLRQGTLRDGMSAIQQRVAAAQPRDPRYLARCARCFLRALCEQCPAKSWIEHGTLDTPVDYFCAVTHAHARDLGILTPGEQAWEIPDGPERLARLADTHDIS